MTKKKKKIGLLVSDRMTKTAVVEISRFKEHPLYHKKYKIVKRLLADNPKDEYKVGDKVIIKESRPLSKKKRWRIVGRVR